MGMDTGDHPLGEKTQTPPTNTEEFASLCDQDQVFMTHDLSAK